MAEPAESKNFINLGVVVNPKGEVLVIRRKKKETGSGGTVLEWAFPGGKQRYGETRAQGVEREVLAETGYEIASRRELSLRIHPQFMITIVYHLCELKSPQPVAEPKEPHEVGEIRWVKPQELLTLFTTDLDPKVKKELGLT
ncbi:MAG: NUDIX hydrolase [Candidatus Jorgensenbacteria bacterium]